MWLDFAAIDTDVQAFSAAANGSDANLSHVLSLYSGQFLDGVSVRSEAFEDWLRLERRRLQGIAENIASRSTASVRTTGDMKKRLQQPSVLLN